jgi:hypothetical protein
MLGQETAIPNGEESKDKYSTSMMIIWITQPTAKLLETSLVNL